MNIWEKIKVLSTGISIIIIPIIVGIIGNLYTQSIKERELQGKFVELAITILNQVPKEENRSLRRWATQIINSYSGVPLSDSAMTDLIEKVPIIATSGYLFKTYINFDEKAELRGDMFDKMRAIVDSLNFHPDTKIWISGHTDSIGTDEYKLKLSERCIHRIISFLKNSDVNLSRIVNPIAYGSWRPLAENSTPAGRAQNRRAELLIYSETNDPGIPLGSKIEQVYNIGDTISIVGNGRLEYSQFILENPLRMVLQFKQIYIADPMTIEINRGAFQQARLEFSPEDASTLIVFDIKERSTFSAHAVKNRIQLHSFR